MTIIRQYHLDTYAGGVGVPAMQRSRKSFMDTKLFGLADAISAVREELTLAESRARGEGLTFPIASLTVELSLVASNDVAGKAGFSVPLIGEFGGSASLSDSTTHRVIVEFGAPAGPDGRPIRVDRETFKPLR